MRAVKKDAVKPVDSVVSGWMPGFLRGFVSRSRQNLIAFMNLARSVLDPDRRLPKGTRKQFERMGLMSEGEGIPERLRQAVMGNSSCKACILEGYRREGKAVTIKIESSIRGESREITGRISRIEDGVVYFENDDRGVGTTRLKLIKGIKGSRTNPEKPRSRLSKTEREIALSNLRRFVDYNPDLDDKIKAALHETVTSGEVTPLISPALQSLRLMSGELFAEEKGVGVLTIDLPITDDRIVRRNIDVILPRFH